jgi:hypothetical protein
MEIEAMSTFKHVLVGTLAVASMLAASTSFAASYSRVGGAGSSDFTGKTSATVLFNTLPCNSAKLTVNVTAGGAASVTAADFETRAPGTVGYSAACDAITSNGLPWTISPPTSDAGPGNVKVNSVSVTIPALGATCPGNVTGTLNNSGVFSFSGALGLCTVNSVSPHLSSSPVVDAIFP